MGNLPPTQRVPQLAALKALLAQWSLKVKQKDLDLFWHETIVLAPWINPENIWVPQIWMRVLYLAIKRVLHDSHPHQTPAASFIPILLIIIASLQGSSADNIIKIIII